MAKEQPGQRDEPAFCNYEGSRYRTDFWEGQGRDYEDQVERIALAKMLPPTGRRVVDLGAGFGRLADLYAGYEQVVLLDYSRSLLEEARERLGGDPRFVFVAGNLYQLPFASGAFDAAVMVRVIHHLAKPDTALGEIQRILAPGRHLVLEYANKRNAKAILRYLLRRQAHNPFSHEPWEFVALNYDFHPAHMTGLIRQAGLEVTAERAVSAFRVAWLKRHLPLATLVRLDGWLQVPLAPLKPTPSVFVKAARPGGPAPLSQALFRCPTCGGELASQGELMACPSCGRRWSRAGGIYDFREPAGAK